MAPPRWLIIPLALGLLVALPIAEAQQRGHIPRIGVLARGSPAAAPPCLLHFQHGLRTLGYVEGQHVRFEYRYETFQPDQFPALATELVRLAPDVLWTYATAGALALKQATTTIPIVMGVGTDLVELGLVESLARPGGNLTGVQLQDLELLGKRLELFKEAVPTITRVAILVDPAVPASKVVPHNIAPEASALGVQLQRVEARRPEDFEGAFAVMVEGGANAVMILASGLFSTHLPQLLALARSHQLPTMAGARHYAEAGSLLAYGANTFDLCQRSAVLVDKILKGAKPADLPVERAYKFALVVNLKTADALGLTLTPGFLAKADEVLR